jgi:hypothetical protein
LLAAHVLHSWHQPTRCSYAELRTLGGATNRWQESPIGAYGQRLIFVASFLASVEVVKVVLLAAIRVRLYVGRG